jgi:transcriptional regulator with XRE-family HTH domain
MVQESLALKLRLLRARKGLTLTEAAELTGVTRWTLGALERGERRPYTPTLSKIARGYGVPVEELMEEPAPIPLGEDPVELLRAMEEAYAPPSVALTGWGQDMLERVAAGIDHYAARHFEDAMDSGRDEDAQEIAVRSYRVRGFLLERAKDAPARSSPEVRAKARKVAAQLEEAA